MTTKDRIKALILRKPIDRVPFMPFFVGFLAVNNGIRLYDFFTNPEIAFQAGQATMRKYPWANIRPVYGWADHGAWEFGGTIMWPIDDNRMSPYTPEPLISSPDEIDRIASPNPLQTEWFKLRARFNEICIYQGLSVQLPSGSIMAQLGSILGPTNLMKWIKKFPEAILRLSEKVLNFNLKMAEEILNRYGPKNCSVMTDLTLESNNLISAETFKKFALPFIIKLHSFFYEKGVKSVLIHLCGDHNLNLRYWSQVPLPARTIFSVSEAMDLKKTGEILGDRHILAGNISSSIIQSGTKEEVKKETIRCLQEGKANPGGYILMPACEWPPLAAPEKLEAVKEALAEYGYYS